MHYFIALAPHLSFVIINLARAQLLNLSAQIKNILSNKEHKFGLIRMIQTFHCSANWTYQRIQMFAYNLKEENVNFCFKFCWQDFNELITNMLLKSPYLTVPSLLYDQIDNKFVGILQHHTMVPICLPGKYKEIMISRIFERINTFARQC